MKNSDLKSTERQSKKFCSACFNETKRQCVNFDEIYIIYRSPNKRICFAKAIYTHLHLRKEYEKFFDTLDEKDSNNKFAGPDFFRYGSFQRMFGRGNRRDPAEQL